MQKFEYDEQLLAKQWLEEIRHEDSEIMERAVHAWGNDFVMQKSEYERQAFCKRYMAGTTSKGAKATVEEDHPGDYVTQKSVYDELVFGDEE